MTFSMSWHIPERVMLLKVSGQVTPNDVKQMNQLVIDNRPLAGFPVHQVIDITEMTKPPSLGTLRQHTHVTDANDGYLIIVGNLNRMMEFVLISIAQIKNLRLVVVPTLEEAMTQLRTLDPSLQSTGVTR